MGKAARQASRILRAGNRYREPVELVRHRAELCVVCGGGGELMISFCPWSGHSALLHNHCAAHWDCGCP